MTEQKAVTLSSRWRWLVLLPLLFGLWWLLDATGVNELFAREQ